RAGRKHVVRRNHDRLVVVGEEVASVELMLPGGVVHLAHQLVIDPAFGGPRKRQTPGVTVGQRNVLQKVLRNRTQAIGGNLIVGERQPGDRVDQLRRNR